VNAAPLCVTQPANSTTCCVARLVRRVVCRPSVVRQEAGTRAPVPTLLCVSRCAWLALQVELHSKGALPRQRPAAAVSGGRGGAGSVRLVAPVTCMTSAPRIADVRLTCFDSAVYEPAEARLLTSAALGGTSPRLTAGGGRASQDSFALVDALLADLPLLQSVRSRVASPCLSTPVAPHAPAWCRHSRGFVLKLGAAPATW
jgi:hypothetical protein